MAQTDVQSRWIRHDSSSWGHDLTPLRPAYLHVLIPSGRYAGHTPNALVTRKTPPAMAAMTPIVPETADKAYAITSDKPAMARIARSIVPMFFCMIIVLVVFVVGACSSSHAKNMLRQVNETGNKVQKAEPQERRGNPTYDGSMRLRCKAAYTAADLLFTCSLA